MARKRMFDIEIINQDSFLDLPMESKALYFLLGMEADDEGFVAPRKVLRLYGGTEDSLKVLILKKFIIPFSTGVIVITDWKRNNYLDKTRIKETIYQDEKKQIMYNENTEKYECLTNVKQMLNQNRIEENRREENNIILVEQIIEYMNGLAGTHFKTTTKKTQSLIKARLAEGFTVDEIKDVVYAKYNEWYKKPVKFQNGIMSDTYYRPDTLFGTKFEGYLENYKREYK